MGSVEQVEQGAPRAATHWAWRVARWICWAFAALMALTLVARAFSGAGWHVDTIAIFAAQEAVVCVVLGVVAIALRARGAGMALLAIGAAHWIWLAGGRAPHADAGADPSRVVRVMTFNYYRSNADTAAILDELVRSGTDVAVLLETPGRLREAIGNSPELRAAFPHQLVLRGRTWRDGIKLSRWPLEEVEPDAVVTNRSPADIAERAVIVHAPGGPFVLTSMHPLSPRSAKDWREGNRDIRDSGAILRESLMTMGMPVVVGVDANATPSGYRTRLLTRLTGLRRAKPLLVMRGTWPSGLPPMLRLAIDDVLVSKGVGVRSWRTVEGDFGSDHVPVVVEIVLPERAADAGGE